MTTTCPHVLLGQSSFVTSNTAGKHPDASLKVSSSFMLMNIETSNSGLWPGLDIYNKAYSKCSISRLRSGICQYYSLNGCSTSRTCRVFMAVGKSCLNYPVCVHSAKKTAIGLQSCGYLCKTCWRLLRKAHHWSNMTALRKGSKCLHSTEIWLGSPCKLEYCCNIHFHLLCKHCTPNVVFFCNKSKTKTLWACKCNHYQTWPFVLIV